MHKHQQHTHTPQHNIRNVGGVAPPEVINISKNQESIAGRGGNYFIGTRKECICLIVDSISSEVATIPDGRKFLGK